MSVMQRGDALYKDVAHAYQSAIAFGLNPRKAIVDDTGVTDSTVSGWVVKARELDYLPPGEQGKVSAAPMSDAEGPD